MVTPMLPVVAGALFDPAGRVLVQQRPLGRAHGGLWEFLGGKVSAGETLEDALVRELQEELTIEAAPGDLEPLAFGRDRPNLLLLLFLVRRWTGEVRSTEGAELAWHHPQSLDPRVMPPADRPLVQALCLRAQCLRE